MSLLLKVCHLTRGGSKHNLTLIQTDKREAAPEPQIDHLLRYWRKRDAAPAAEGKF